MKKKDNLIAPEYFDTFRCIGGACEDSCCIGWDIDIDKLTFRQYYRVKDISMLNKFKKHVYLNEDCYDTEVDYGRLKVDDRKWCPFLDDDKYCNIYKNLDESYLSNVCSSFPRVINKVNGDFEVSLFLSCPEAARLVLLNDEKITYRPSSVKLGKHILTNILDTTDKMFENSVVENFIHIRADILTLLQDRTKTICERLYLLGEYIEELEENPNANLSFESQVDMSGNMGLQLSFFQSLIDELSEENVDSESFNELTRRVKDSLLNDEFHTLKDKVVNYKKTKSAHAAIFSTTLDLVFENELVNFTYQNLFPLSEIYSIFDQYMMLIIRHAFMRFYLLGNYEWSHESTMEDTVMIISKFTKTIDHHRHFLEHVYAQMKQKEYDHMTFVKDLLFD